MGNALFSSLMLVGGAIFTWYLVVGLRTGEMEAPGSVFLFGSRTQRPLSFWLLAAFNFIFAAGGFVLALFAPLAAS